MAIDRATGELLALQTILGHKPGVNYFTDGREWRVTVGSLTNGNDPSYASSSVDFAKARTVVRDMMRAEALKRLAEYRTVVAAMAKVLNDESLEDAAGAAAVAIGGMNAAE